jgi:DNA mismatch repair protein MutL
MKGRYPVCCLFLEIDPALVDVNIHPAKREVRFHNENSVRRAVAQAVREALLSFHTAPAQATPPPPIRSTASVIPAAAEVAPIPKEPELNIELSRENHRSPERTEPLTTSLPFVRLPWPQRTTEPVPAQTPNVPAASVESSELPPTAKSPLPVPTLSAAVPLLKVPLRLVGVVGKLYVVLESDRGMVLLDQHAAHERILFERVLRRMEQGNAPSQKLLLPETIELSPRDADFLRGQIEVLSHLGVELSEFGERTFLLDGLPPFVKAMNPRQFVLGLVDELRMSGDKVNSWRLGEHTVAKMVCRHAVKANDALSVPELENLIEELRQCAMPYTCPHGRPTLIEMNFRELEKKFGRTA